MQDKRVLVTGKNGDLSKAISKWLTDRGYMTENISLRGNEWKNNNFGQYDAVVHVAGIVPKEGVTSEDFYRINAQLTKDFAEKAKKDGIRHFLYISSMAVYGKEQSIDPCRGGVVADTPCVPLSDYGKSKLQAEEYLQELENDAFIITRVRVPSIYGKGKTEYLEQYRHLNEKFKRIPVAFIQNYKSAIYIDNLCELIYLLLRNKVCGAVCPDDGKYSAVDICQAVSPSCKKSKILGFVFKTFLRKSDRIRDYYGAIYYDEALTNIFEGKYRVVALQEAVSRAYER